MNIPGYVILLHKMLLTVLSVVPFRITPVKIHDTTNLLPYLTRNGKTLFFNLITVGFACGLNYGWLVLI
jgi:hypothetical protein